MKSILFLFFFSCIFSVASQEEQLGENSNYRVLLNSYYLQDKELLVDRDVLEVSQAIISKRNDYTNDMVAKAFSLLSDIAFNRGDLVAALQFAQYGKEISKLEASIKLDLLLKLARGYYSQGKYRQLIEISSETSKLAKHANNMNYHLQASAYSVVAHALIGDYSKAITELNNVEHLLDQNQQNVDQVKILEIIAEAHFYLAEYQNAIELLNHVLKLRVKTLKKKGIARTYHLLATAYYQLEQYDNAYNFFWESMVVAAKYGFNIRVSYAELGLGQVLYQQKSYLQAKKHLTSALDIFEQYSLPRTKLSVLIALAKVHSALNETEQASNILLTVEKLANELVLTPQQIELYLLLANYYQATNQLNKAIISQQRYIELYQSLERSINVNNKLISTAVKASEKSKEIALNLAEESELTLKFTEKYYRQNIIITLLSIILGFIVLLAIAKRLFLYRRKLNQRYDEIELPKNHMSRPEKTKYWYQQQYKIARKYQYNISIGYLAIENWQELTFHFSTNILNDIYRAIAVAVNENCDEEDYAGEISAGEYLFLCPHQDVEQIRNKLARINNAINMRHFVNLGDYPVNIRYSIGSPSFKDIDPYVFLAGLNEQTDTNKSATIGR